jgi:hypothetical protein
VAIQQAPGKSTQTRFWSRRSWSLQFSSPSTGMPKFV